MNTILIDQVIEKLAADPWISSHELLQRCSVAKTGEQITDALQLLRKHGRAQYRIGKTSLIWALAGVLPPIESTAPTPHKAEPYRSYAITPQRKPLPEPAMEERPQPEAPIVNTAEAVAPKLLRRTTAQCNQLVLDALAAGPLSRKALREATGLCPSPLHAVLLRLSVADKIVNQGRLYALAAVRIESSPGPIEPGAQPAVASNTGSSDGESPTSLSKTEPTGPRKGLSISTLCELTGDAVQYGTPLVLDIDSATFALWSDGRLHIHSGDLLINIQIAPTRNLVDYLDNRLLPPGILERQ